MTTVSTFFYILCWAPASFLLNALSIWALYHRQTQILCYVRIWYFQPVNINHYWIFLFVGEVDMNWPGFSKLLAPPLGPCTYFLYTSGACLLLLHLYHPPLGLQYHQQMLPQHFPHNQANPSCTRWVTACCLVECPQQFSSVLNTCSYTEYENIGLQCTT